MSRETLPDVDDVRARLSSAIHAHWKLFLAEGIVMLVLGLLAIAVPEVASLAIAVLIGWLFFVGGIFRTISVWQHRAMPGFGWSLAAAILAIILGLILLLRPVAGVLTLTIVLVAFFILEGISAILLAI